MGGCSRRRRDGGAVASVFTFGDEFRVCWWRVSGVIVGLITLANILFLDYLVRE